MNKLTKDGRQRQEMLKNIIKDLHAGADVEDIKARFGALLDQVGPSEIGELEQRLIEEGLPVEEIQKLCDVHVAIFRESLDKQTTAQALEEDPIVSFQKENEKITRLATEIKSNWEQIKAAGLGAESADLLSQWRQKHGELLKVERHYSLKENVLFPYLERHGISGPPAVMWGVHDEIRQALAKTSEAMAKFPKGEASTEVLDTIDEIAAPALQAILEMVYKEENILFPMCKDTLTPADWQEVQEQLQDPAASVYTQKAAPQLQAEGIGLDIGVLTPEQINLILTHLPVDVTYVDENDEVRYFSLGPERIFERTRAIIGRKVQFCHPPSSMDIVQRILDDFKSRQRDVADFWIKMRGQLIYIRYFAVRDGAGAYRGTLEVSQNVTGIQNLQGEKRIYDY